ncbi:MAG: sulfotransferase [Okeania sp. SIO2C2]|uniref:sulfotransferase n=1 Tax=Okeania sp. SIO2C2 TaxID=2607787 RepID=UPI0013B8A5B4|nr:sulfotransferase [Okeania sp. SIO2C2]NEP86713.1 sulfotransferase [Okeania sp. SIO2C2]
MSHWIGATLFVVGFLILVQSFQLVEKSKKTTAMGGRSLDIIRSSQLSEEEKESLLQKNAKDLFGLFFILAFGGIVSVILPLGLLWLAEKLGWLSLDAVFKTLLSPVFLILSTILAVVVLFVKPSQTQKTWQQSNGEASSQVQASNFSGLDRALYYLAFNTSTAQIALADMEDSMFAKELSSCRIERPVFITALPRAGTTLLLECFDSTPEFATHCYRDMPFVLIPCLWDRFSKSFQKNIESQERAHGDGMQVTPDSPEALEEVVWKTFWKRHYHKDRIIPWENETDREFEDFFRSHMRKIIMLRKQVDAEGVRYVSKNNLNIARTKLLNQLFPDSIMIIPFRDPFNHTASLLKQHRNFLRIHQEDSFASDYMRAIGHYDFGKNLCPVDFDSWFDKRESKEADSLAFWLEYWVASYRHLLAQRSNFLNFLNYDAFCENPEHGLRILAEVVDSSHPETLMASATSIHHPRPKDIDTSMVSSSLLEEVNLIYEQLKEKSLN